jgi:hypothetical protein
MKFKYEDLQPHIEMVIDALENRGACASGLPYDFGVTDQAKLYRTLLENVRNKSMFFETLLYNLQDYKYKTLELAGNNQRYRITQILNSLDIYFVKEYNKHNN